MKIFSAALALTLFIGLVPVSAAQYPSKPVKIIVATSPGSDPDIVARLLGDRLGAIWGQQVLVDNRPGAGGINGMSALVRSAPDGYTLALVVASVVTITPVLYKNPQFNVDTDVTPVAIVATNPFLLVANPGIGVNTLSEFITLARTRSGKIDFATVLNTAPYFAGEMLSQAADIKLFMVPYKGAVAAAIATSTGESQAMIYGIPALVPHIKAGKIKALAVTSMRRVPGFETVPTVSETIPGFEAVGWFVVLAQSNVPAPIVDRVNHDINTVIHMPDIVRRFADLGMYPAPGSPRAAADFVKLERSRWKTVLEDLGVQPQ